MTRIFGRNAALFILLLVCFQSGLFAQDFIQGVIVTSDGIERTGFVQFRSTDSNPKRFRFREKPLGPVTVYEMGDLISVVAGGNRFEFAVVDIEVSVEREPSRKYDEFPFFEKDSVYLRVLLSGSRMLYQYRAPGGRDYFYTRNLNGKIELLVQKYWEQRSPDWIYIRKAENEEYKKQIAEYLQPFDVTDEIKTRLRYTKNDLVALVQKYYDFQNEKPQTIAQDEKSRLFLGVLGGRTRSDLYTKSPKTLTYLDDTDYNTSLETSYGLAADVLLSGTKERASFYSEMTYTRHHFSGSTTVVRIPEDVTTFTPDFDLEYLRFTALMRYKLANTRIQPFVNAGFSISHLFRQEIWVTTFRQFYGTERTTRSRILNDPDPRQYSNGVVFGGGLMFRGFSVEARYERNSNFSGYGSINAWLTNVHMLVMYRFEL
jgi:hypothetical protein